VRRKGGGRIPRLPAGAAAAAIARAGSTRSPVWYTLPVLTVVLLGVLQGATEFLPVSSSGHLVLAQWLLGVRRSGVSLEVALHAGTLVAVAAALLGRIRRDWRGLLLPLAVASLPAAAAGLVLRPLLERAFEQPAVLGAGWLATGAGLLWAGRSHRGFGAADAAAVGARGARGASDPALAHGRRRKGAQPSRFPGWARRAGGGQARRAPRAGRARSAPGSAAALGIRGALVIGLFQAVALVPGVSRSGAALLGGLAVGLEAAEAATFAFLLALPSVGGAVLLELPAWRGEGSLWLGAGVAALAGAAAIRLFLGSGVAGRLGRFGAYCAALGLGMMGAVALHALGRA
jgi:undecaprenyl-diphosphatase